MEKEQVLECTLEEFKNLTRMPINIKMIKVTERAEIQFYALQNQASHAKRKRNFYTADIVFLYKNGLLYMSRVNKSSNFLKAQKQSIEFFEMRNKQMEQSGLEKMKRGYKNELL